MKNRILFLLYVLTFLALITSSCEKLNDLHQKYLDEGARIYVGKPDSVIVKSGYNQIRLIWLNNSDPKISKTIIYYNFGRDSVIKNFVRSQDGHQWDSITLNLSPGDYLFSLKNIDSSGTLTSVSISNMMGKSYGDSYRSLLENRAFTISVVKDIVKLNLSSIVPYNSIYSIVRHYSQSRLVSEKIVSNDSLTLLVEGIKSGDTLKIATAFQPEKNFTNPIEAKPIIYAFESSIVTSDRTDFMQYNVMPYDNTTQHSADYKFKNILDNDYNTLWITSSPDVDPIWGANKQNNFNFPLSFTIDMNEQKEISQIEYTALEGLPQAPKKIEVWGTNTIPTGKPDTYWATTTKGPWQDDWVKLGDYEATYRGSNTFKFSINPQNIKVRYIRILVQELFNGIPGNIRIVIADLKVYEQGISYKLQN